VTPTQVIVEADGGSRGNPGPAGYGAVVFDSNRSVLAERKESIGIATNNVAEYRGLIAGLTAAGELGASTVDVRMTPSWSSSRCPGDGRSSTRT